MNRLTLTMIPAVVLLGLTALVYWPGLNGPLILDDVSNLDILRRLSEQGSLTLGNVLAERGGILGGRPVSWMFFVWNWEISGPDVWSFKLVNLLIHLGNGALALVISRCLLSSSGLVDASSRHWLALAVCGFWLLTPIQVSTVLYVVQRMTLLATMFSLIGVACYCLARQAYAHRPRISMALITIAIVICWPLATLSKQNGILLVALLLVLELLVFSPRDTVSWPRRTLLLLTGLLITAGVVRVLVNPGWVLDSYVLRDFTLEQRLLTQPRVLFDYVLNILQLPGGSALGLFHDDFPLSKSNLDPWSTLPAIVLWVCVLTLAWRWRGRAIGLIPAGVVFFLVGHALEAGPFSLEIYFEHRNYLPSFGIWFAVMVGSALLLERVSRRRLFATVLAVVLTGHAVITAARVSVWRSFDAIVEANALNHPGSRRARAGAAAVAFTDGAVSRGLGHLEAVSSISGHRVEVPVVLKSFVGYCLANREPDPGLLARLRSARGLVVDPYTVAAIRWYRTVSTTTDCPGLDTDGVSIELLRLVERHADERRFGLHWQLYDDLARIFLATGQREAARRFLRLSLASAPRSSRGDIESRLSALEAR